MGYCKKKNNNTQENDLKKKQNKQLSRLFNLIRSNQLAFSQFTAAQSTVKRFVSIQNKV